MRYEKATVFQKQKSGKLGRFARDQGIFSTGTMAITSGHVDLLWVYFLKAKEKLGDFFHKVEKQSGINS